MGKVIPFQHTGKVIPLQQPKSQDLPEQYFGSLGEVERDTLKRLGRAYDVHPGAFLGELRGEDAGRKSVIIENLDALLSNKAAKRMLLSAKKEVFSREDRFSSQSRFYDVMSVITAEMANHFSTIQDFSGFGSFSEVWESISFYDRYVQKRIKKEPTAASDNIRKGLKSLMDHFLKDFQRFQVVPLLYGSVRYGDANINSDIDLIFPYSGAVDEKTKKERKKFIGSFDDALMDTFDGQHFIDENADPLIYIPMITALADDMVGGETTKIDDYSIHEKRVDHNTVFYHYHLLMEGVPLLYTLGEASGEFASMQDQLIRAAEDDPFFQFIITYKMIPSLEKRIDHIYRC